MPQRGADVDIVTGRPRDMAAADGARAKQDQQEARLREQMQYLDLTRSADGQVFIRLVEKYLEERIRQLVMADEQSLAYIKLLNDMGQREWQAQKALRQFTARFQHKEEL